MPPVNRNPSLTVRFLAYAGDFSLGQLFFHGLISVSHVRSLYESMRDQIALEGAGGDALATLLSVYVLTTIIRFYTSAFLGVSFFQWFLGISNGLSGLSGRLCAAGRVAIEFFLLPTLLPMLPTVSQKPSYIEKFSTALLKKGQGFRGFLGYLARPLVIAFVFLGVFAPLLRNLAVIEGVQVEFSEIPAARIESTSDFSKFRFFPSNYFGLTTFSDLDANRFVLLPQFEVTKEGSETRVRPFLGIYDTKNQSLGFLKKQATLDWPSLAKLAARGNPFFHSSYPFLARDLSDEKNTFSDKALIDLEELVIASLELSFNNVKTHVRKHGPFLGGYVDLRQALLSLLDSGAAVRADAVNLGDQKFLRFRQLFDEVPSIEKKYREVLLPFNTRNELILRYEWDANMESAVTRRDFGSIFFAQARWEGKDRQFDLKDFSALSIIDFLLDKNMTSEERHKLHERTYQWFWNTSREALMNEDNTLITWMALSMGRIYLVTSGRPELDKLRKMFLMMRHALESRDMDFFDLGSARNE